MKKKLLLIIVLFVGFSLSSFAQTNTTKRIYLSNGNVINLPVHLIDKAQVENHDGIKQLKITQESGNVIEIPVNDIDSITHKAANTINPGLLGELRTTDVTGIVYSETGLPLAFATVTSGFSNHQTRTDVNGVFFLDNILAYEKLGLIKIEKQGYFSGSRSFLPLDEGRTVLRVQLLPRILTSSFNGNLGGSVTTTNLQIDFPASAIAKSNGQPYTGTVNVYAKALDPSDKKMFDQMPGSLLGGINDELQILRSFGMAAIEITGSNNEILQLKNGSEATLKFTVPGSMLSEAPAQIDCWSFDKEQGFWKHESTAQLQGNTYIAQAAHFSWWNCDIPENFVELKGVVKDEQGNPIPGASIEIVTETFGSGIRYSNTNGEFSGLVPRNQNITTNIQLTCNTTLDWITVFTDNVIAGDTDIEKEFIVDLPQGRYLLSGKLLTCQGQPVQLGYVKVGGGIFTVSEGNFSVLVCATGSYVLRGFDIMTDTIRVSDIKTIVVGPQGTDAGDITVCESIFGTVSDIEGNIYVTVKIGTQEWMAENLKTTRFADGTAILNVTSNSAWSNQSSSAWCNYGNNVTNDFIYGKLYNWYSVANSNGLCPAGWHVPSDAEWKDLELGLGMDSSEISLTEWRGLSDNTGGKLKAMELWTSPNTGATNSSSFSGFPGGSRDPFSGGFRNIETAGSWWSATESVAANPFDRTTYYSIRGVSRIGKNKRIGYSVRCLKN